MARSTFKVLFYVNGSKEKDGIVPIMGRVTINGTVAQFSCKQTIPKTLWDAKGNRAKGKSAEARNINLALDNIKAQIIKHYQRISDREAYVTAEMVRNAYQGVGSEYETLIKAFDKDCANFLKRVGKDRSIGTYKVMVRARNYVAAFIKSFYRRTDMSMLELTPDFIKEFAAYLTAERGLKNATIWLNCMWLKGVVMRAHYNGLIPRNPFAQFHISPNVKEREKSKESWRTSLTTPPGKAKKEQENGKRKYRKKSDTVRLCADDLFNRQTLIAYHDNYARVMAKYGLQRGVRGSEARHTSTTQYYRDMKKKNDALDMENKRLQEQKAEAEQELKRAKKEVQTEKQKGAATTAATNIAESVGSLFGSGKMKALERRNEDLQDRILELEEEARQREQQQTKQIQEIKTAYEQQNSKLSEFVDFVKRYFPYVEKLMPTIKFLRDTLNFGDAVIRKLCTFKDVSIKGELYSREFNQHFRADKTICSLKEDKDGNFNLNIDGVSHVSWFRRKKDEFMQSLGMPTRKQDKGIRL